MLWLGVLYDEYILLLHPIFKKPLGMIILKFYLQFSLISRLAKCLPHFKLCLYISSRRDDVTVIVTSPLTVPFPVKTDNIHVQN